MAKNPFTIDYAKEAVKDLKLLRAFDQTKILDAIEKWLKSEPTKESRTRIKRMKQPFWSQYRLRVDDFRVYYDVDETKHVVGIIRILEKGQKSTEGGDES
jgi:mRNA-degrading endonuclease RelE of RelBE toxin-antitoxin system